MTREVFSKRELVKELGPVSVRTETVLTWSNATDALCWLDYNDEAAELRRLAAGGEITVHVRGPFHGPFYLNVERG